MKKLALIFVWILLSVGVHAQEKSTAQKIDEYSEKPSVEDLVIKVQDFIKRLEREPSTTHGAILFTYKFRWVAECLSGHVEPNRRLEGITRKLVDLHTGPAANQIAFIEGRLTGRSSSVEFWLVPNGVSPPKPDI